MMKNLQTKLLPLLLLILCLLLVCSVHEDQRPRTINIFFDPLLSILLALQVRHHFTVRRGLSVSGYRGGHFVLDRLL